MGSFMKRQFLGMICINLLTVTLCAGDQYLTLVEGPTDQVLIEGSSTNEVSFACVTKGNPTPEIAWARNDRRLEGGGRYRITVEGALLISGITRGDHGDRFRCKARNNFGALFSQEATLIIAYVDTSSQLITTVNADDKLCLPCSPPDAYPGVQFKWIRRIGDRIPEDVGNSDRLMILPDGELCFAFANTDDAGEYSCLVASSYDLGQTLEFRRSSAVTFVVDQDTIDQETPEQIHEAANVTALRGQTAVLQCFFRGRPLPIYEWSRSGQPLDQTMTTGVLSHRVIIKDVQPQHSGVYSCTAMGSGRNETATVYLDVASPPRLTTHLSDTDVRVLSNVSFECASDAPGDVYAWYYNAEPIQFDEGGRRFHLSQNTLNIGSVVGSDSGVYQCSVSNRYGTTLSTAQLRVPSEPPIFDEDLLRGNFYRRSLNGSFKITCNVTGADTVRWNGPGGPSVKNGTLLQINRISFKDQGSYDCEATRREQTVWSEPQVLVIKDYLTFTVTLPGNHTEESEEFENQINRLGFELGEIYEDATSSKYYIYMKGNESAPINSSIVAAVKDATKRTGVVEILSYCPGGAITDPNYGRIVFPDDTLVGKTAKSNDVSWIEKSSARATCMCKGNFTTAAVWSDPVIAEVVKPENTNTSFTEKADSLKKNLEEGGVTEEIAPYVAEVLANLTAEDDFDLSYVDTFANGLREISKTNSSSESVTKLVMDTISNIITVVEDTPGESDSKPQSIVNANTSSEMLQAFEQQIHNIQSVIEGNVTNFTYDTPNVAVVVAKVPEDKPVTFTVVFDSEQRINATHLGEEASDTDRSLEGGVGYREASIRLPKTVTKKSMLVSFVVHRSDLLFTEEARDGSEPRSRRNTVILSASIESEVKNLPEEDNIEIRLPSLKSKEYVEETCVFWKERMWSDEGCETREGSSDVYTCRCNHLTNFAVLVDPKGDIQSGALDVLSVIGCVLSILSLTVTIITYLSSKRLRCNQPKQIILNISFALLGLYITFLVGIERADAGFACEIFGALLHFFVLAAVMWMSIEATNMYLLFVKVFNANVRWFMLKASAIGWGIPSLVVIICLASSPASYRTTYPTLYCFPDSSTLVFKIAVLGLVASLLSFNFVIFLLVTWKLTCARKNVSKRVDDQRNEILHRLINAVIISIILGMTWIFGLLAVGGARMFFNVLFCLFNSLQGCCIFLFFCVMQKDVRSTWAVWFHACSKTIVPVSLFSRSTSLPASSQDKSVISDKSTSHAECSKMELSEIKTGSSGYKAFTSIPEIRDEITGVEGVTASCDDVTGNVAITTGGVAGSRKDVAREELAVIDEETPQSAGNINSDGNTGIEKTSDKEIYNREVKVVIEQSPQSNIGENSEFTGDACGENTKVETSAEGLPNLDVEGDDEEDLLKSIGLIEVSKSEIGKDTLKISGDTSLDCGTVPGKYVKEAQSVEDHQSTANPITDIRESEFFIDFQPVVLMQEASNRVTSMYSKLTGSTSSNAKSDDGSGECKDTLETSGNNSLDCGDHGITDPGINVKKAESVKSPPLTADCEEKPITDIRESEFFIDFQPVVLMQEASNRVTSMYNKLTGFIPSKAKSDDGNSGSK